MNIKNAITRANPGLIIFTVDMSGSMSDKIFFEGRTITKCEAVNQMVNINISEIIDRCSRGKEYNDYFHIIVLGYSGDKVASLLAKYSPAGRNYTTVSELMNSNIEPIEYKGRPIVDGVERVVIRPSRKFVELEAFHTTPMYSCLTTAYDYAKKWCAEYGKSANAPIFINITDGEATDATNRQLIDISEKIKSITTTQGNSIFVNIHINNSEIDKSRIFPTDLSDFKDIKFAELIYEMSSELSEEISKAISRECNIKWEEGTKLRAVGYNTPINELFNVLQIGSISIGI